MKVTIIGTGNVATVLGKTILKAGHAIHQVFGRNAAAVKELASALRATPITETKKLDSNIDIFFVAVSDKAIAEVCQSLPNNILTVHTSGAVSKDILKNVSKNYGVLYPLQSLRKEMTELPIIPLFVDGSSAEVIELLTIFARSLSSIVQFANDAQRLKLHLAAVLCSNFPNHLYALTEIFCRREAVNFSALQPLVEETALRLRNFSALQMQTGPAVRGDEETMKKHLDLLQSYPVIQNIYTILSESIMQLNDEEKDEAI